MHKTQGYFIAIAIVVTLVYLIYGPSPTMDRKSSGLNTDFLPQLSSNPTNVEPQNTETPDTVSGEAVSTTEVIAKPSLQSRIRTLQIPTTESTRRDIAENPHLTPPSLVRSAAAMKLVFNDVQDENSAKLFLDRMRECTAENADVPVSMKSSCVRYLDRLEKKFPRLKPDIESVRAQASPDAIELEKVSR